MKTNNHVKAGYKASPLGIIPEDWEVKRLGDCFEISAGGDLEKDFYSTFKTSEYCYPIFSNTLENKGLYGFTSKPRYKGNSITITGRGTLGHAEYRTEDYDAIIRLLVLTPRIRISCKLIADYINFASPFIYESTGIPQLTAPQIKRTKLLIPPFKEQERIVSFLQLWDTAMEKQRKLIEKLKLRKRGLMQQLLTGKKRLPGFKGKWLEMRLGEILSESNIPIEESNVEKRITVKLNLQGVEKREVRGTEEKDATVYFVRKEGQFIYGKQNLHKGAFGIIPRELDGFQSSSDIPAFDITDRVLPKYFLLHMSLIYESLESLATGTGSKRIHPETLCKKEYLFPKLEEQLALTVFFTNLEKQIELANKKLGNLQFQKKGLMQQLLTGKKRIRYEV